MIKMGEKSIWVQKGNTFDDLKEASYSRANYANQASPVSEKMSHQVIIHKRRKLAYQYFHPHPLFRTIRCTTVQDCADAGRIPAKNREEKQG
jgi:hypothetical protein